MLHVGFVMISRKTTKSSAYKQGDRNEEIDDADARPRIRGEHGGRVVWPGTDEEGREEEEEEEGRREEGRRRRPLVSGFTQAPRGAGQEPRGILSGGGKITGSPQVPTRHSLLLAS